MDVHLEELRTVIDGFYVLEEWHNGEKIFRPPQVEARFVLLNGGVAAILVDKMDEANQTTNTQFGIYSLKQDSFEYRWDSQARFTQALDTVTASPVSAFDGVRSFTVNHEGNTVRFRSHSAEQAEFCFTADTLEYFEGEKLLRVWRRAKS